MSYNKRAIAKKLLTREPWRFRLWDYASHVSDGAWIPYNWSKFLAWEIQKALHKGGARILVNAPPQHGKSELISHWLPTWYLDTYPTKRVILGSYGDDFSSTWGYKVRGEFFHNKHCITKVVKDKSRANDWQTTAGGGMRSVGVGGSITGRGGDLIVIDDPHKDWEEALSPTYRRKVIDWFKATLYTRKSETASFIIIQTRWHEEDLTGTLLKEFPGTWTHYNFPALAEGPDDLLGREEGEALCVRQHTKESLLETKRILGSYKFAGLYQQRPAPAEGGMVQRAWFQRFGMDTFNEIRRSADEWLQAWDLTFSPTGTSYVVGQVWARKGANLFLMDQFRNKIDFPDTIKQIEAMSRKWPSAITKAIEDKANGPAVIATLKNSLGGIIPVSPRGSKEARLAAVSGLIEAGNVYIPDNSVYSWAGDMIEEVVTFPSGANDDQVDAMTMALDRLYKDPNITNFAIPSAGVRTNEWSSIYG